MQDALSAMRAAREVLAAVSEELTVARELESLERDRFALGDSTQFLVNLREVATADAALREVKARADEQKALVAVDAATAFNSAASFLSSSRISACSVNNSRASSAGAATPWVASATTPSARSTGCSPIAANNFFTNTATKPPSNTKTMNTTAKPSA